MLVGSFFQDATAQTTVQIGTGTTTSNVGPIASCYGYSYIQQIYTATEMIAGGSSQGGVISKVRFYFANTTSGTNNSTDWTVYIGNTTKSIFTSNTDWVGTGSLTNCFSGTVSYPGNNNWLEITLTTPFIWDGTSNIVVGVDENQANYNCSVYWQKSDLGANRLLYYQNDSNNPNPASPPSATGRYGHVANVQFVVTPFPVCSTAPAITSVVSTLGNNICEGIGFGLSVNQTTFTSGVTYQWQQLNGTNWEDIIGATSSTYTNTGLAASTDFQVVATCAAASAVTTNGISMNVNPTPTVLVDFPNVSICLGDAATFTASGAATYAWSPATNLSATNTAVVNSTSTVTREYTVTGTDANGCINTATAKVTPNASVTADIVVNPAEICTSGSPVSATIGGSLPMNTNAGVWNFRFLEADGVTEAQAWSTNDVFNFIPMQDSTYNFFYQLSNTACSGTIAPVPFNFVVGFGGDVTVIDYNCVNLGGTITVNNAFGQQEIGVIYSNPLVASSSEISLQGNAVFADNRMVITPSATSRNGQGIITIPNFALGTNNAMNVSFLLTMDQPINVGADGMSHSFGNDVSTAVATPLQNGRGSKLRLCFDAIDNSTENGNIAGIYLVYGWTSAIAYGPASPQVLAFSNNTGLFINKTDIPVSIIIDAAGKVKVTVDGIVVFDGISLPASYQSEDVTSWKHNFSAFTGGYAFRHAVSNFEISSGSVLYGTTMSPTATPTNWQTSNTFSGLAPGTYQVWLAKDSTATCSKNLETIEILNTNPVINLGADTTICQGSSLLLDAQNTGCTYVWSGTNNVNQTHAVTQSGTYTAYATDAIGCFGIGSINVSVSQAPTVADIYVQGNYPTIYLSAINPMNVNTYSWNFGDGTTSMNAPSGISHTYTTPGDYIVTLTITNSCGSVEINKTITVLSTVSVDALSLEGLSIYPNPVSSDLTISLTDETESFVTITSVTGAIILNTQSFLSSTKINVEGWQAGVYFVTVSNKGASTTQRIVVK